MGCLMFRRCLGIFRWSLIPILGTITSACTTFDFDPPKPPTEAMLEPKNINGAIQISRYYISAYDKKVTELANTPQIFEVPLIIAGAVAAGSLAFGAHPDIALAAALAAGTLVTAGKYYAPRARAAILRKGIEAMSCVRDSAKSVKFLDGGTSAHSALGSAAKSQLASTRDRTRALPFRDAAIVFSDLAAQARSDAFSSAAALPAANMLAGVRRVVALDALASAAGDSGRIADALAARAQSAYTDILDSIRQIRNLTQQKVEASSAIPTFSGVSTALKSSQIAAYELAGEMRATRKRYQEAEAEAGVANNAPGTLAPGAVKDPDTATAIGKAHIAASVALSADAEVVATLKAELAACVVLAPQ